MTAVDRLAVEAFFARGDSAATTKEKGDALEDLIVYLFELIPGISNTHRRERSPGGVQEIDVAFWNDGPHDGLRQFDKFVLIECKNWSSKVGHSEIVLFRDKLESRGMPFGILVAAAGITGNVETRSDAHHALYSYLSSGQEILVLRRAEILKLESTDEMVDLLIRKRLALRLGGNIFIDPRTTTEVSSAEPSVTVSVEGSLSNP